MLEELRTGSVVTERELRVVRRDGRALDCLFSFAVGRDGPDDAVVLCGTLQDISAEERRYEELVTSEERYHLLFEQSDDAIALVRVDGVLLDANQVFLDLFGYSRSDIGRVNTAHTYVKPADRERFMHQIAEKGWLKDEVGRIHRRHLPQIGEAHRGHEEKPTKPKESIHRREEEDYREGVYSCL